MNDNISGDEIQTFRRRKEARKFAEESSLTLAVENAIITAVGYGNIERALILGLVGYSAGHRDDQGKCIVASTHPQTAITARPSRYQTGSSLSSAKQWATNAVKRCQKSAERTGYTLFHYVPGSKDAIGERYPSTYDLTPFLDVRNAILSQLEGNIEQQFLGTRMRKIMRLTNAAIPQLRTLRQVKSVTRFVHPEKIRLKKTNTGVTLLSQVLQEILNEYGYGAMEKAREDINARIMHKLEFKP